MAKSKVSKELLESLSKIRKGTYKQGTKGYKILMEISMIDPLKIMLNEKHISHNLSDNCFYVE